MPLLHWSDRAPPEGVSLCQHANANPSGAPKRPKHPKPLAGRAERLVTGKMAKGIFREAGVCVLQEGVFARSHILKKNTDSKRQPNKSTSMYSALQINSRL